MVVQDTIAPSFDAILDQVINVFEYTSINWTEYVQNITDNSSDTIILSVEHNVEYGIPGIYSVTITAADYSSNEFSYQFSVAIVDIVNPTITLIGDATITIEYGDSYTDQGVEFSDNVSGAELFIIGEVVENVIGTYQIEYLVTDTSDNQAIVMRTVIIQDTIAPTITLSENLDTIYEGDSYSDGGVQYFDQDTVDLVINGVVNINIPGSYTITYVATDISGNSTSMIRVVTVLDGIDIVTFVLSKGLSSLPIDAEFIDTGCNVVVNNQLLPCSAQENTVDTSVVGIYTVTYEIIVDENSYTYTRYVYVYNESFALQLYYYKEEREW